MKLRRVKSTVVEAEFRVEALINDQWRRLESVEGLGEIACEHQVLGDLASDLLAVLQLGKSGWDTLTAALEKLPTSDAEKSSIVVLPFQPASFREFTLYEEHIHECRASSCTALYAWAGKHNEPIREFYWKNFP